MGSNAFDQGACVDITHLNTVTDLSAKQYYFAKNSSGNAALNDTAGGAVLGVIQNAPNGSSSAPRACHLRSFGVTKLVAGGTIAVGDRLKSDNAGKAVAAQAAYTNTSDAGAAQDALVGSNVVGLALEAAASGETFTALVCCIGAAIPTTAA